MRVPLQIRLEIYEYLAVVRTNRRVNAHVRASQDATIADTLNCVCRQLKLEIKDIFYSKNTFMLQMSYGNLHYPDENYLNSLMQLSHLRYISNLAIDIMVGHRAAIDSENGYQYDTEDTKKRSFQGFGKSKMG